MQTVCLLHTRRPLVAGGRVRTVVIGASKGMVRLLTPGKNNRASKTTQEWWYEGIAHSFRQPYFRRWLPDRLRRLQRTLPPSMSVVSQTVCVHTDPLYLQQPLAQAPISSVLLWRCRGKYWLCLWWNVIVVSLSGRIRKRRVMRQDGRWWMRKRRRRKVLLMGGICHRMQRGGWKQARLSRVARNPPRSGTLGIVCESIRSFSPRLQQRPLWHVDTCGGWLSVYFHFAEWANAGEERWEEEIRWQGSWSGLFFWKQYLKSFLLKLISAIVPSWSKGGRTQIKCVLGNCIVEFVCC